MKASGNGEDRGPYGDETYDKNPAKLSAKARPGPALGWPRRKKDEGFCRNNSRNLEGPLLCRKTAP